MLMRPVAADPLVEILRELVTEIRGLRADLARDRLACPI